MASTYLSVSTTSSGTRTKWTTSFWVKRCSTGAEHTIFGSYLDSNNKDKIAFDSSDRLQFASVQAGSYSNGGNLVTNRLFRDTNAWYHIVLRWDTNNSTADDRMKIWVNGVEETSFSSRTNPTSGRESLINYTTYTKVGNNGSSGNYFDGVLSHIHFCDNYTYSASDFGSTDSTTGEWKINTSPSVSYGTNGFWWLKDSIATTDHSPNSNPFTVSGGTLTKTEDCPSNVFATLNSIDTYSETDYSNGNTKSTRSAGSYRSAFSTLGFTTGKYYAEFKVANVANGSGLGVLNLDKSPYGTYISGTEKYVGINDNAVGLFSNILYYNNVNQGGTWTSWSNGDIIGLAVDATNGYAYWSVNGTWQNSGNPSTGSGGYALSNIGSNGTYVIGCSNSSSSTEVNFGNGYFGTTAVSSAGTNASGIGIFEYDVPTGYTALSTKGLNL